VSPAENFLVMDDFMVRDRQACPKSTPDSHCKTLVLDELHFDKRASRQCVIS
jgi:hypothetical protein